MMRKLSGFWLGYLCLVLLTACVQKDEPVGPGPDAIPGDVGSAQIRLPAIPPGFLAKRTAGPRDSVGPDTAHAYFILTISGPGMTPRRMLWPLDSTSATVTVGNIPVGSRLFTGELALGGDVRYADSAWALIEKGKTAFVHLKLSAATGDAEICVEIEGLPLPAGCGPVGELPDVSGCWYFVVNDSLGPDTAHLRITQTDSSLLAEFDIAGRRDSAFGWVQPGGRVAIGSDSSASFAFTLVLDSNGGMMTGQYTDLSRPPYASRFVRVLRHPCPVVPEPVDSLTCWSATQYLGRDTTMGRYLMITQDSNVYGLFQWNRFRQMPVTGFVALPNAPIPGAPPTLYLYGSFPPGMVPARAGWPDSAHYKGQLRGGSAPAIANGSVNRLDTTGNYRNVGSWFAAQGTCTAADRRAVLAAHGL